MRHKRTGKKLNRNTKERKSLVKNLINSLIEKEEIKTTLTKAKVIKRLTDKLMTKAKTSSLSSRRQVISFLQNKKNVHKLFDDLAIRTKERTSGFTSIIKLGQRRGDNAEMAQIKFIDQPSKKTETKAKK